MRTKDIDILLLGTRGIFWEQKDCDGLLMGTRRI
jgi:hypothetical protein